MTTENNGIVCAHQDPTTDRPRFVLPAVDIIGGTLPEKVYCYSHGRWERVTPPEPTTTEEVTDV